MVAPNLYQIQVQHSQLYLAPQMPQQGAKVVQVQQPANWEITQLMDGYVQMKMQGTNLLMDLAGNNTNNGGEVIVWGNNNGENQKWKLSNGKPGVVPPQYQQQQQGYPMQPMQPM